MWTNGLQLAGASTAFPSSAATNDVYFRTDLGILYYYSSTGSWIPIGGPSSAANFSAHALTVTACGAGGWTVVTYDSKDWDVGNNYSTSTSAFTAPDAGKYQFFWSARIASLVAGKWIESRLLVNGSSGQYQTGKNYNGSGAADFVTTQGAMLLNLAAGDAVRVQLWNNDTLSRSTSGSIYLYFQGQRIA